MSIPSDMLPLAGIKVVDLSRILAGPMCAMVLADLGADVVKVEHPQRGDDTRGWGRRIGATETTYFDSGNRNKRSVTVDLQMPEGQGIVRALAREADIVIENFKHGGAAKLGLGYPELAAVNPGLVYCSIGGYDPTGPEAGRPGYDLVVQGESGLMAMNGEAGQQPLKFGVAVVDLFTGMHAAQAVMAALIQRGRTGRGRHVQLALYDCGVALTSYYGLEALLAGEDPPRYGNEHPSIVPYGQFEAADGPLILTVGNDAQFRRLCEAVIDRPELAADPRFATNLARSENRAALRTILAQELGRRQRADLLRDLAAAGIPCGQVLGLHEALTSPRTRQAGLVTEQPHPQAGSVHVLAPVYRFDGVRCGVRVRPPLLGEHTDQVLAEAVGASPDEIAGLRARGIV